ncbi:MAG: class I SAM-dependent methyltransferase [Bdellovibrionota bacterium]
MNGRLYDIALSPFERFSLRELRADLLKNARGRTLEIGFGTGLNLPHYPHEVALVAVDPDPEMLSQAKEKAAAGKKKVDLTEASAEKLPFEAEAFDTVVATLVFCSVKEPKAALGEIVRVLKPGGRALLLEHIRYERGMAAGKVQDFLTPLWMRIAGGCHLNRNPEPYFESLDFNVERAQSLWFGFGKLWVLQKRCKK